MRVRTPDLYSSSDEHYSITSHVHDGREIAAVSASFISPRSGRGRASMSPPAPRG